MRKCPRALLAVCDAKGGSIARGTLGLEMESPRALMAVCDAEGGSIARGNLRLEMEIRSYVTSEKFKTKINFAIWGFPKKINLTIDLLSRSRNASDP